MSVNFDSSIVCGCVIVRGRQDGRAVPAAVLLAAKRLVGDGAMTSSDLTRIWGAAFVVGQPRDLAYLRRHHLTDARRAKAIEVVAAGFEKGSPSREGKC